MNKQKVPLISDHLIFHPENEDGSWNEKWKISIKGKENEAIGVARFEGAKLSSELSVYVELSPEYRNMGYGAEIFYSLAQYAFRFHSLREICAVCDHHNDKCVHALEKAGYVYRGCTDGMDYYSMKRQKTAWMGLYVPIGFIAGLIMGIVVSNLWAGTITGILTGSLLGFFLDKKENESFVSPI